MTGSPAPHVCHYVDVDGTTAGACHLAPPHGGRCPTCAADAVGCAHQATWELVLLCRSPACEVHR